MKYTLTIKRYDRHMEFDSIHDLRGELCKYFSLREIGGGVIDRLTNFKGEAVNGHIRRHYKDYTTCCYIE